MNGRGILLHTREGGLPPIGIGVGVECQRAGEAVPGPDRTFQDLGGELGDLAVVTLPAETFATTDVDDEAEVEDRPADRNRQRWDIQIPLHVSACLHARE